ncbi:hypothetical protein Tco_1246854 [Tanacetum coccineum]
MIRGGDVHSNQGTRSLDSELVMNGWLRLEARDEIPPPPPPSSQTPTQQTPHTVSTIKLPILKKGEYDIWAMKMEHYLAHIDYQLGSLYKMGHGPSINHYRTQGQIQGSASKDCRRDSLPENEKEKLEMWKPYQNLRFGWGNDESKKMQKYILKQQFNGFSISNSEGLHKGYDRFQSLLSQLEIHGAGVSTKDANQKFLRSLPSAWSQVSLIMRTKLGGDNLSFA